MSEPKILFLDIETLPIEAYTWGIWEQNIGLNQIKTDWTVLSWAAKWLGDHPRDVLYQDVSKQSNKRDDSRILRGIWNLLNEADIIITQNGKSFDAKKLNARFIINGMKPPSPYKHIDTKQIAKRVFAFTSNSLAYMAGALGVEYKKLEHKEFPGFELWSACMNNNKRAWKEMQKYNKHDVLTLEAVYNKLQAWEQKVDFNLYRKGADKCNCGSARLTRNGYFYTASGKFQRYSCNECGAWVRSKDNLLSKDKRKTLKKGL